MASIEWLIAAIIFILTSGLIGRERFQNNPILMSIVAIVTASASIGSIVLLRAWIEQSAENRIATTRPVAPRTTPTIPADRERPLLNVRVAHYVNLADAVVVDARKKAEEARSKQQQCLAIADKAAEAAQFAKDNVAGYAVIDLPRQQGDWPRKYYGQVRRIGSQSLPDGFGTYEAINTYTNAVLLKFAGTWSAGEMKGLGVVSWPGETRKLVGYWDGDDWTLLFGARNSYASDEVFAGGKVHGLELGVITSGRSRLSETSVVETIGQFCTERCLGAEIMKDGSKFVGEFLGGKRNIGVLFDRAGRVVQQGFWKDRVLFLPLDP